MLLDCPACARSYHVNPAELGGGRTVVCPRCHTEWFAEADGQAAALGTASSAVAFDTPGSWRVPSGNLRLVGGLFAVVVLLMVIIGARASVVRAFPRTQALFAAAGMPVNVRGLAFSKISFADADNQAGAARVPDMAVIGEIRNVATRRVRMPRLAFEIRDAAGESLLSWTEKAPARSLAAGDVLAFKSAPHAMPEQARSLLVRFETDDPHAGRS